MKEVLVAQEEAVYSPKEVFCCPEESQFYAQCIEKMVLNQCTFADSIVEFGSGDGSPVISSLIKNQFDGAIHGFELNPSACALARSRIKQYRLQDKYVVYNRCFFKDSLIKASYLIANPPYLPAPDNDIYIPSLHGGIDGASITKELLSLDYENVMLMISAFSNPAEVVDYASEQGYQIVDFTVAPLRFGYYSCEPKVRESILELREQRKAFYSQNVYFLAGVLFRQRTGFEVDLSQEFLKVMTVL